MMILTGKTITATVRPPYPYGGEFISQFIFALQLCWFPMLISTVAFGFGAPGLQAANFASLFGALDRARGLLRLGLDPRVRPLRDRGRGRRGGGDGDHRRPRGPQDPRGARRPPGPGRRPDQEPGRAPLPRPDADHRPARHLRAFVRDRRRRLRHPRLQRPPGRLLRHPAHQRLGDRALGLDPEDDPVRGDHRDRLLLQGHERLRGRRRGRPGGQRGRRDRLLGRLCLQLRLHPDPARHPPRAPGAESDELTRTTCRRTRPNPATAR